MSQLVRQIIFHWRPSPSGGIRKRELELTLNGDVQLYVIDPSLTQFSLEVAANSSFSFRTILTNKDGRVVASTSASGETGDLLELFPDTELGIEYGPIREIVDPPPPPDGGGDVPVDPPVTPSE